MRRKPDGRPPNFGEWRHEPSDLHDAITSFQSTHILGRPYPSRFHRSSKQFKALRDTLTVQLFVVTDETGWSVKGLILPQYPS